MRLADYAGGSLLLYFYPAALTPGCTLEAVDFSKSQTEFAGSGYRITGISPDSPTKLAKFASTAEIEFPLLSDPERETIKAYGAWGTRNLYGKEVEGVLRSTFVIDVDGEGVGTIRVAKYNVKATGHVARLLNELNIS